MKKLYRLLFAAVVALCTSFAAQAEDVSVTVKWDVPGSLVFKISNQVIDVPADATEFTFVREKTTWPSLRVEAAPGYVIESGTYENPAYTSAPTGTVRINSSGYASLSFSGQQYNGATVTFKTKKLEKDGKITLNIVNGASFIDQIYFVAGNGVSNENISLDKGNTSYELPIYKGIQKQIYMTGKDGQSIYEVTGGTVSYGYNHKNVTVTFNDGDVINVRVFEGEEPVIKDCTVTLQYAAGIEGCIASVFNTTAYKSVTVTDNKFVVREGQKIRLNFDADYTITSINGGAIAYNSASHNAEFTVTDDMTVSIEGAPRQYGTVTYTAYLTNPEGVEFWEGNSLSGNKLDLGEGTLVSEAIVLKSVSEGGQVLDQAYTIPAGTAYKYTFKVSEKYGTYSVYEKAGYYLYHGRLGSPTGSQSYFEFPASQNCILAIAKVNTDSNLKVIVTGDATKANLRTGSLYGGGHKTDLENGYNSVGFDAVYDNPFSFTFYDNDIANLKAVYNGQVLEADDNGRYSFTAANGGVLHVYNDGNAHAERTVTFNVSDDAYADISYHKGVAHTDFETPAKLWDGAEVVITPEEESYLVTLDGEPLEANSLGDYVFTVSKNHTVAVSLNPATPELFPANQGPVTSLENVTVTFPYAKAGTVEMAVDEAMVVFSNSYAPSSTSLEDVSEAYGYPAWKFTVSPAPAVSGAYRVYFPEGFFKVDGVNSSEIMETYNLNAPSELTWAFDPEFITAGEYPQFAVLFDENHAITAYDESKISVSVNGEKLAADEFQLSTEMNMLFGMISAEKYFNVTGTLTLDIQEGAISFEDGACPAISHTWDIIAKPDFEFVIEPGNASFTSDLSTLTLTIVGASSATVTNANGISLRDNRYSYSKNATITAVEGAELPTFKLELPEIPATNDTRNYTLTINYGTFLIDGKWVSEYFTKVYSGVTEVSGITADGTASDAAIYNLQGQRLQSEWKDLPAGLYIRGGQKIIKH